MVFKGKMNFDLSVVMISNSISHKILSLSVHICIKFIYFRNYVHLIKHTIKFIYKYKYVHVFFGLM